MSAEPRDGSGTARWLALGLGCLLAVGALGALVAVLWAFGFLGRLPFWPAGTARATRAGAVRQEEADPTSFRVARGDPKRLDLPLPRGGDERSLTSLHHRADETRPEDDFAFDDGTEVDRSSPAGTPSPGPGLAERLAAARRRRDAAFERYTRLITTGGEGSVEEALREYRASAEALAALEKEAAAGR